MPNLLHGAWELQLDWPSLNGPPGPFRRNPPVELLPYLDFFPVRFERTRRHLAPVVPPHFSRQRNILRQSNCVIFKKAARLRERSRMVKTNQVADARAQK